jgi:hypothetical protein
MEDIGAELDAVADGAERLRAFEHTHRKSVMCERECGGEPTKPAPDNEDGILQGQIALNFGTLTVYLVAQ